MHCRHRHWLGYVDVAGEQIFGVEAEREIVVRPEQEDREAADRDEQPESDPIPCAHAVLERTGTEQRACERGREDQRGGSCVQALDCGLLLEEPAECLLIDECRGCFVRSRGRPVAQGSSALRMRAFPAASITSRDTS